MTLRKHSLLLATALLALASAAAAQSVANVDLAVAAMDGFGGTDTFRLQGVRPIPGTWTTFGPSNMAGATTVKMCQSSVSGNVYELQVNGGGTYIGERTSAFVVPPLVPCFGFCRTFTPPAGVVLRDMWVDHRAGAHSLVVVGFDTVNNYCVMRRTDLGGGFSTGWTPVGTVGDTTAMTIDPATGFIYVCNVNGVLFELNSGFVVNQAALLPLTSGTPDIATDIAVAPCVGAGCGGAGPLVVSAVSAGTGLSYLVHMDATGGSILFLELGSLALPIPLSIATDDAGDIHVLRSDGYLKSYQGANTVGLLPVGPFPGGNCVAWLTRTCLAGFGTTGTTLGAARLNPVVWVNATTVTWDLAPTAANPLMFIFSPQLLAAPTPIPGGGDLIVDPAAAGAFLAFPPGSVQSLTFTLTPSLNGIPLYTQWVDLVSLATSTANCWRVGAVAPE